MLYNTLKIIINSLLILYPFMVFFGLQFLGFKNTSLILLTLISVKIFLHFQKRKNPLSKKIMFLFLFVLIINLSGLYLNSELLVKLYPVFINLGFFLIFFISLFHGATIVEKIATFKDGELSHEAKIYTRKVTKVWCVFFILNALIALTTAIFFTTKTWTLYNGFISYILMGILFLGEFIIRKKVKTRVKDVS